MDNHIFIYATLLYINLTDPGLVCIDWVCFKHGDTNPPNYSQVINTAENQDAWTGAD
jgi:hypothetical protein